MPVLYLLFKNPPINARFTKTSNDTIICLGYIILSANKLLVSKPEHRAISSMIAFNIFLIIQKFF